MFRGPAMIQSFNARRMTGGFAAVLLLLSALGSRAANESDYLQLAKDSTSGHLLLTDRRAQVTWDLGVIKEPQFTLDGRSIELRATLATNVVHLLDHALGITRDDAGCALVPAREGLLVPADAPVEFSHQFPTSGYEGCHMNMLGFVKHGAALLVTWDDVEISSELTKKKSGLTCSLFTRSSSRRKNATVSVVLTPLGQGDWNTIAAAYREVAMAKGLAVTLREKARRNPEVEKLLGASNAKLWMCLARRRNEASTKDESVKVNWTFAEAAQVAEHLQHDLGLRRCLFTLGGWTTGGYDCRHPDALPANAECGGNSALADAVRRIRALGYVACFHDNYQDMYRDAKSWNPDCIQKNPDGSLMKGGRWMGGRAYMVCAPKMLELAQRPQSLPAVQKLFAPQAYFIDTTYAVDPQQCYAPQHPLTRADDIRWKQKLSDYTRGVFGLFGSEDGREWAVAHSDFFEGLSGVSGKYFHNLNPATLGATPVPLFEMVYHDCEAVYGKYGYKPEHAAEYVAHHLLCARTLNYHSIPEHLYWTGTPAPESYPLTNQDACYTRADNGWAQRLCKTDRFVKNTHEILSPLAEITAHSRLVRFEFLTPDRAVRRATYADATGPTATITVNFGTADYTAHSDVGQDVILPEWGFLVEAPRFTAFQATRWAGQGYASPVLFAIRSEGSHTRIFHGFGDAHLVWQGQHLSVPREIE